MGAEPFGIMLSGTGFFKIIRSRTAQAKNDDSYGPGRAATTLRPMRFRVQQLDQGGNRFVLCTQPAAGADWRCRIVRTRQLQQLLDWLGFEDHRDAYQIYQQAQAAVREFGLGAGYIEYDLDREQDRGPDRFRGDLRPEV